MSVSAEDLAKEIVRCMSEYNAEVVEKTNRGVDKTAEGAFREVKANATWRDRSGKYRKSLEKVVAYQGRNGKRYVVRSKDRWQLSHLLEEGHEFPKEHFPNAKVTKTRAFPHMEKGQIYADENIEKNILEELDK